MKSRLILLAPILSFSILAVKGQDVITKIDDTSIETKVVEITPNEVKYKNFHNLNGPTYTLPINEVLYIVYENGLKEVFNQSSRNSVLTEFSTSSHSNTYNIENQTISDTQLLAMEGYLNAEKCRRRTRLYKRIGWIGGGAFVLTGGILIISGWADNTYRETQALAGYSLVGAGIVWCTAFNIAGNLQAKKVRKLSNIVLYEKSFIQSSNQQLSASVNMLSDKMTYSFGFGLSYSF